jgi:outer membrane lipoprotein-sorting protein
MNQLSIISMKKIALIPFIILLGVGILSAKDQKAKSILDKVSEKTRSYTSITANFDFIMENTQVNLKETSSGTLITQGDKYKLSISGIDIISDGVTQWTYMKDAKEVSITGANSSEEEMINPATIFTIYEKGFEFSYLGEVIENGKKVDKVDLVPTNNQEFTRVVLNIDKTNQQIVEASMYGTDGNRYIIKVNQMETTKRYPESTFVFDPKKNPGVTVIDMR